MECKCDYCGKTFTRAPSKTNYCSKKCGGEDTGNCPVCGCEFTMKLHRFKSKSNNYCSKRCNARDRRGSRSGNWQGGLSGDTKEVG